ncbi:GAP family protein [Egibacter rhizosphaerae]|uniref:GAP family protein n=1 Tax=Egibacter rhizosphaerae TaxID=1670831 RepID=UPI0013F1755C|nr:GAP family protein [Egibacter rhizosphaerae]
MFSTLTALALADSLHLLAIAAAVYLLGTEQPFRRTATFVAGLIGTHFAGGVLLVVGWGFVPITPPRWWSVIEWGVIAAILVLAIVRWRRGGARFRPPASLTLPTTFGLGVVVSLADLAFDLPYHLAAARIAASVPTMGEQVVWLAWFNLVYALPLLIAMGAYAVLALRRPAPPAPTPP